MNTKFIFFSIAILASVLSFYYLQTYDEVIKIYYKEYVITTHFVSACIITLLILIAIVLIIKILFLPFALVNSCMKKLQYNSEKKLLDLVIDVSSDVLMNQTKNLEKTILNLLNKNFPKKVSDYFKLLMPKLNLAPDTKISNMEGLVEVPKYKLFACREISRFALQKKSYKHCIEFAQKALDVDNKNVDTIELMIDVYGAIESWDKLEVVVDSLKNLNEERFLKKQAEVFEHFFKATEYYLTLGELKISVHYLNKCLEYQPGNEKLILFSLKINPSLQYILNFKAILERALATKPSFKIFLVYMHYGYGNKDMQTYNHLIKLINKKERPELCASIALYLGLEAIAKETIVEVKIQ